MSFLRDTEPELIDLADFCEDGDQLVFEEVPGQLADEDLRLLLGWHNLETRGWAILALPVFLNYWVASAL